MDDTSRARVLTIAGSDSGGGAGIEADLKTFAALGAYGMAAVTAITAQNTCGVYGVHNVPPEMVSQQIDVVATDIGIDAAKTGMLSTAPIIEAVADSLERHPVEQLVVDPVMVATSGDPLLENTARDTLINRLLPLALVVTPTAQEAEVLAGISVTSEDDMRRAAERIHALGPKHVLVKGGHLDAPDAIDLLFDGDRFETFSVPRINTRNTHGTGCTYAAAIAASLGQGMAVTEAVQRAKTYLTGAIQHGLPLGEGSGPVDHAWRNYGDTILNSRGECG